MRHECHCKHPHSGNHAGEHRNRLTRHAFDDPLCGERANERARTGHAKYGGIASCFDAESCVDYQCDTGVTHSEQELAAATRHDRETHLVVAQMFSGCAPVTPTTTVATTAKVHADSPIQRRRQQVQCDGHHECEAQVEQLKPAPDDHAEKSGSHTEHERERVSCHELMRFDETGYHRGACGVQHARGQQQHTECQITDERIPRYRRDNCADGQQCSKSLTHEQEALTRIAVSEEASERPDQEQRKRSDEQPPQEGLRRIAGVQVKEQHLREAE